MKLAIALISILGMFNFLSSADAVRSLDDSCAYCMTDENPSLTYRQALEIVLVNLDWLDVSVKRTVENGIEVFSKPVITSIVFGPTDYLQLEEGIKVLRQVLALKKPYLRIFTLKHSPQADLDAKKYSAEYLLGYSVDYALATIGVNAWNYKKNQKELGKWHDCLGLIEEVNEENNA